VQKLCIAANCHLTSSPCERSWPGRGWPLDGPILLQLLKLCLGRLQLLAIRFSELGSYGWPCGDDDVVYHIIGDRG
jgi:hypothetical protein